MSNRVYPSSDLIRGIAPPYESVRARVVAMYERDHGKVDSIAADAIDNALGVNFLDDMRGTYANYHDGIHDPEFAAQFGVRPVTGYPMLGDGTLVSGALTASGALPADHAEIIWAEAAYAIVLGTVDPKEAAWDQMKYVKEPWKRRSPMDIALASADDPAFASMQERDVDPSGSAWNTFYSRGLKTHHARHDVVREQDLPERTTHDMSTRLLPIGHTISAPTPDPQLMFAS